ncbi:MAG: mechanosensitive ion channel family protein [Acidimicrobiales bacterium]|jgi:small-conductance mechanosensitive channel
MVRKDSPDTARTREHHWAIGISAGIVAVAALVVGSDYGKVHGPSVHKHVIAWVASAVLLAAGIVAVRRIAAGLDGLITKKSIPAAGAAVRLIASGVGYVLLIFCVFAVIGVSVQRLLIGAGLAGVVLGIAAQQSLGNVFASLVLLFARPFGVGDHIRIRSGTLGVIDVYVLAIGLTYVTVRTDDGNLKIPNSVMLAAGIGQFDPAPHSAPTQPKTTDLESDTPT